MRLAFLALACHNKVTERVIYVQWASVAELPSRHRNAGISGYRGLSKITLRAHIMLSGCQAFCQRWLVIPQGTHVASGVPINDHIYPVLPIPWCFTCKTSSSSFAYLTLAPLSTEKGQVRRKVSKWVIAFEFIFWVNLSQQASEQGRRVKWVMHMIY